MLLALTGGSAGLVLNPVEGSAGRSPPRRHSAVSRSTGLHHQGERYWLTEDELMAMVAQELATISRKDVKQITKTKPKVISKAGVGRHLPLERLEARRQLNQRRTTTKKTF